MDFKLLIFSLLIFHVHSQEEPKEAKESRCSCPPFLIGEVCGNFLKKVVHNNQKCVKNTAYYCSGGPKVVAGKILGICSAISRCITKQDIVTSYSMAFCTPEDDYQSQLMDLLNTLSWEKNRPDGPLSPKKEDDPKSDG